MIKSTSRRRFIAITPFAGIAFLAACSPKSEPTAPATSSSPPAPMSPATTPTPAPDTRTAVLPMLEEKETQALALGYVSDATKADTARFKNYAPGSQCSNCALYQGKVGMESGPCPLFAIRRQERGCQRMVHVLGEKSLIGRAQRRVYRQVRRRVRGDPRQMQHQASPRYALQAQVSTLLSTEERS